MKAADRPTRRLLAAVPSRLARVSAATAATPGVEPGRARGLSSFGRAAGDLWGPAISSCPRTLAAGATSNERRRFFDNTRADPPRSGRDGGFEARRALAQWRQTRDVQVRRNKGAFPFALGEKRNIRSIRPLGQLQLAARDVVAARLGFGGRSHGPRSTIPTSDLRWWPAIEADDPGAWAVSPWRRIRADRSSLRAI